MGVSEGLRLTSVQIFSLVSCATLVWFHQFNSVQIWLDLVCNLVWFSFVYMSVIRHQHPGSTIQCSVSKN